MFEVPRRPGFPELMLAVILLVLAVMTFPYARLVEDNPYVDYEANPGIRIIIAAAFAIDVVMFVWIVVCAIRRSWSHASQLTLIALCAAAIAFIWLELWWGSTFYYGEVRDKQGIALQHQQRRRARQHDLRHLHRLATPLRIGHRHPPRDLPRGCDDGRVCSAARPSGVGGRALEVMAVVSS